ncbi:MAG: two pore domain potassium channel family protein [Cyanobacteria bacterium Co-bin13]|nr:two pore domain potassium channel family protein [Cyanobacteria bacterium Co-bin13]
MTAILVILGAAIILFVTLDIVVTTLTVGGAGPLMERVAGGVWWLALKIHQRRHNHTLLVTTGWLILVLMVVFWLLLTWVGWTLVFSAAETAVVNAETDVPANFWERVYFTGFTIATLGIGDYQPQHAFWQIATAVAAANGFFFVTLGVAYLLPVASAVAGKRALALYISTLGGTGDEIIRRSWNGRDFGQLDQHLINLAPMMSQLGESHLTYPILYYFHSIDRTRSMPLSIAALDEALTLLQYGVLAEHRPDSTALVTMRRANAAFLNTLRAVYLNSTQSEPPLPNLDLLRSHGIPTVSDEEYHRTAKRLGLGQRRKLLLALLNNDGWSWDAIASSQTTNRTDHLDDEISLINEESPTNVFRIPHL